MVVPPPETCKPRNRGALAAGQDQGVETVEILLAPDPRALGPYPPERGDMGVHIALNREDTDPGPSFACVVHQPRFAMRSLSASLSNSIPGMASARPRQAASTSSG